MFIQTKNEPAAMESEKCEICYVGKKKIMYGCHKHLTCVACSYRSYVCPYCRNTETAKKIKVFD